MESFGFSRAQRLRSKKDFESLVYRGNSFTEFPLKFKWLPLEHLESPLVLAISAPKRRFKHAVDRNRIKRQIRQSFRILSPKISSILNTQNQKIALLIVYIASEHSSQIKIHNAIEKGLHKIIDSSEIS